MYKEREYFSDEDEPLVAYTIFCSNMMLKMFERIYSRYDFTQGEFTVLHCLHGKKKEVNLKYIQQNTLVLSGASITKVTEKLVKKKYLVRRENPVSRREKLVKITPAGDKIFGRMMSEISQLNRLILRGITPTVRSRMIKDLKVMFGNLTEMWDSR